MTTTSSLNPDYGKRAARDKAMVDLMKLGSEPCRMIKALADFWNSWELPCGSDDPDQITAFRELCEATLGDWDIAQEIEPVAETRQHLGEVLASAAPCFRIFTWW